MKVVHEGGPWTRSRWWSMDWGQCYVYTPSELHIFVIDRKHRPPTCKLVPANWYPQPASGDPDPPIRKIAIHKFMKFEILDHQLAIFLNLQ